MTQKQIQSDFIVWSMSVLKCEQEVKKAAEVGETMSKRGVMVTILWVKKTSAT